MTGATIPAGDQLLTNLVIENPDFSEMCIEDAVLSDSIGGQIDTSVGDCINIPSSQVQIIHNSASPTVDAYVDGGLAIEGFEYRTATGLLSLPASFTVGIAPAGEGVIDEFPFELQKMVHMLL